MRSIYIATIFASVMLALALIGAAAALVGAASLGARIGAIVSRGGRPDLAGDALEKVSTPRA